MRVFTTVYTLLLVYIIAALVFWFISLQKQSRMIYEKDVATLHIQIDSIANPGLYQSTLQTHEEKKESRTKQYTGEGVTFLLVILIGAAVVYASFRRSVQLSRQQHNFMLSVTHELKSPIAAVKLNLQTLERHKLDEEKEKKLIDRSISEANRLNDLCNNMLIASQMEGRQYVSAKEQLNFTDIVRESASEYHSRYPGRFEKIDIADVDCKFAGDRLLLQLAVNNLLENAVKYSPADKPIDVLLFRRNKCAVLQVKDQGPGVADKEKRRIFNKFYRLGNEETRKTKGTGLGLYLTSKIIKRHKGKIRVMDNVPAGAIFEIQLPFC
jgi:signal transduction histidine kinase